MSETREAKYVEGQVAWHGLDEIGARIVIGFAVAGALVFAVAIIWIWPVVPLAP